MAFTFQVLRGSTTYTFSGDGQPIRLVSIDDVGGASVRTIEESGPEQDGATHLDYRLEPRVMNLRFNVVGATPAQLDGYRDTLNAAFRPIRGVPITLKITRDDGTIRQIDTQRAGPLAIPLEPNDRPGNVHRAVVQLRAADPLYYDPTQATANFGFGAPEWWLAGGAIGTANVLTHVEFPAQGQLWSLSSSVAQGNPWTIVWRSTPVGDGLIAFIGATSDGPYFINFDPGNDTLRGGNVGGTASEISAAIAAAGDNVYFAVHNGGTLSAYRGTVLIATDTTGLSAPLANSSEARWRSNSDGVTFKWTAELPMAAIYNIALGTAQIAALNTTMAGGTAYQSAVVYAGDYETFPVVTIHGPIVSPVIVNQVTGDSLDFTGGTIGSTDIWTIDMRYGRKHIINAAGSSVANYLSTGSDLATFSIVPAPISSGGTNIISVGGSATTGTTSISIAYYKKFLSY